MKYKWSLPLLIGFRRPLQRRREDATDIFRAFVHRLERMRALSRSSAITGATLTDKA